MQLFETIDRAQRIHRMIQKSATGTPAEFAERLHISRRSLYYLLDELKDFGAEIAYDRTKCTFYYANNFELELIIKVSPLTSKEKSYIYGGNIELYFDRARRLHGTGLSLLL